MKRNWSELGALRLLIPFILGILLLSYFTLSLYFLIALVSVCCILTLLLKLINTRYIIPYADELFGMLVFLSILSISILSSQLYATRYETSIDKNNDYCKAQLLSKIIEKDKSYRAEVLLLINESKIDYKESKAIIYFQKDSSAALLKSGDFILTKNNFQIPTESLGESKFNYRRYLSLKNIYFTSYQKAGNWKYISSTSPSYYKKYIGTIRSRLQSVLSLRINSDKERAIASALLLGNKSFLDQDIKQTYSQTGAMHILAVSGLHVGILYGILALLFSRLKANRIGRISTVVIELLVIWLFAAITEFSPSVSRAAVMFTFISLGSSLTRYTNIYNVLSISALLLLIYNPNYLFEVGFQLSYAAVFSIIFFHKYIYRLFMVKNKVLDFFWNISAVSIAAQIGTAPLTMLYFGQFPTYFFMSNLIAIPAATLILWIGMLLFTTTIFEGITIIGTIQNWIGYCLETIIHWLNIGLEAIQMIPYAVVDTDNFQFINTISLYLVVLGIMYFLYHNALKEKRFRLLLFAILFHILTLGYSQIRNIQENYFEKEQISTRDTEP